MDQTDRDIAELNRHLEEERRPLLARITHSRVEYNIKLLREHRYPEAMRRLRSLMRAAMYMEPDTVMVRGYVRVRVRRSYSLPSGINIEGNYFSDCNGVRKVTVLLYSTKQENITIY